LAESLAHKFGQIIGEIFENSVKDKLQNFVNSQKNLYLDKKGTRPARGKFKKATWKDKYGNSHDLDFVIERNGTSTKIGDPIAFIECAWRRYTKHSRNKAQEIQGAVGPLLETYSDNCPFAGAVIGGIFTNGSITQLQSLGFKIVYFDYNLVLNAFSFVGVDAAYDENTPEDEFKKKIEKFESLSPEKIDQIKSKLLELKSDDFSKFLKELKSSIDRTIKEILIFVLHGEQKTVYSVIDAITYIKNYQNGTPMQIVKFEIIIRFNNNDKIDASFSTREAAIKFLEINS
jgi:hypothetical protein